jgi:hypothetical protein
LQPIKECELKASPPIVRAIYWHPLHCPLHKQGEPSSSAWLDLVLFTTPLLQLAEAGFLFAMNTENLSRAFERIGARLLVTDRLAASSLISSASTNKPLFTLNVANDRLGETFVLRVPCGSCVGFGVIEVRSRERYLLLQAWEMKDDLAIASDRLLCGYENQHWFVAAA